MTAEPQHAAVILRHRLRVGLHLIQLWQKTLSKCSRSSSLNCAIMSAAAVCGYLPDDAVLRIALHFKVSTGCDPNPGSLRLSS